MKESAAGVPGVPGLKGFVVCKGVYADVNMLLYLYLKLYFLSLSVPYRNFPSSQKINNVFENIVNHNMYKKPLKGGNYLKIFFCVCFVKIYRKTFFLINK